jgi:hypothetical protein
MLREDLGTQAYGLEKHKLKHFLRYEYGIELKRLQDHEGQKGYRVATDLDRVREIGPRCLKDVRNALVRQNVVLSNLNDEAALTDAESRSLERQRLQGAFLTTAMHASRSRKLEEANTALRGLGRGKKTN